MAGAPTPAAGGPAGPGVEAVVVVDAANVVGARPDGWWRDRPGAARRLVERLAATAQVPGDMLVGHVVVVLEGRARSGVPAGVNAASPIRVVHAPADGDDAVVAEVEELTGRRPPVPVLVVTSDAELRRRVARLGAEVTGPRWLYDLLERAGDASSPRKNRSIAEETSGPDGSV